MTEAQLIALIAQFRKETEDLISAVTQRYYFNDGVPYATTAEVLSLIPIGERTAYMTVNVDGVEYWFLPDLTTLQPKQGSVALTMPSGTIIYRKTAEIGQYEFQTLATLKADLGIVESTTIDNALETKVDKAEGYSLVLDTLITKIHSPFAADEAAVIQNILDFINTGGGTANDFTDEYKDKIDLAIVPNKISLPASGSVSGRITSLIEGTNYPTGWTLTASGSDLVIAHGLNKDVSDVKIWSIDGNGKRQEKGAAAFVGLVCADTNTLKIESLATVVKAIDIYIEFV